MRRRWLIVLICIGIGGIGRAILAQEVATRPAFEVQAAAPSPEFPHTRRVPMELLDRKARNPLILPSEPASPEQAVAYRSEAVFGKVPTHQRRLPEGYVLGSRRARIERQGEWLVAILEPAKGMPNAPPLRLLPSETLEMIEAVLSESTEPITFLLTGRVTEFQSVNYLLVEHVAQVQRVSGREGNHSRDVSATSPTEVQAARQSAAPGSAKGRDHAKASQPPTAEEVAEELMAMEPVRALVVPRTGQSDRPAEKAPSGEAASASGTVNDAVGDWPEGTLLADRVGRVMAGDDGWWMLAFEDPGLNARLKPIRLLPNRLLETALSLSEGGTRGVVFQVSGEVCVYRGVRYLLLRKVLVRRDLGNFR